MPTRLCLALIVISGCGAPRELALRSLINPFRMPMVGAPSAPHRDIRFVTVDGFTLDGWLFEPPAGAPSRGLVVFLHGKDANRGHFASDAVRFTTRGYTVLAYDQRGHGRSEGEWCTFGIKEVPDLQRTIVVEHTPFFMTPASLAEAVQAAEARAGFHIDEVNPARDALDIHVPALLLHGSDDPYIAPQHSHRIRKNLSGPAQLVTLTGVGHIDVLLHEESWAAIEHWFDDITVLTASALEQPG